jgi:hypothetical protein
MAWLDGNMPGACGNSGTGAGPNGEQHKISVSPNPFNRGLRVSYFPDPGQPARLEITNSCGMVILEQQLQEQTRELFLDTGNWSEGIYVVGVMTGSGSFVIKAVKSGK